MIKNNENIAEKFYLDREIAFFNSGSYGTCPKPVLEEKIKFLHQFEFNPNIAFSELMFDKIEMSLQALSTKIGAKTEHIALLSNVTCGISTILQNISFNANDGLLLTDYTYGAVRIQVEEHFVKRGGVLHTLRIELPVESNEAIVNTYKRFVDEHPNIKFAIVDHISSRLPLVMPVKQITSLLRQRGIFVIIDGAHAPGQLCSLNVPEIDADVYIGNLHKWCFVPRGTGFLVVHPQLKMDITPPIVSWLRHNSLHERFMFMGTTDVTNMMCVQSALDFIESIGGSEAIYNYNTDMLKKGIEYLENQWNVKSMTFPQMAPFMRLIPFPNGFEKHKDGIIKLVETPFERQYFDLISRKYKFVAPAMEINDKLHFRICCQVFTSFENFQNFSEAVLKWLNDLDETQY